MAYTQNKEIKTRISLKYDSFANWQSKNPTLLTGELAIAYLGDSHTTTTPDNGTHPILFKVGPGAFNSLPWASGLAADVYAWAKASDVVFDATNELLQFKNGTEVVKSVDLKHFASGADLTALEADLKAQIKNVQESLQIDTDTTYTFTVSETNGDLTIQAKNKAGTNVGSAIVVPILTNAEVDALIVAKCYTKGEVDAIKQGLEGQISNVDGKFTNYYTKTEANNLLNAKQNTSSLDADVAAKGFIKSDALTPYAKAEDVYDKDAIDGKITAINNTIDGVESNFENYDTKDQVNTKISTALKSYYDKDDVDDLIKDLASAMNFIGVKDSLPASGELGDVVIVNQIEYVWDGNAWRELGDQSKLGQVATNLDTLTTRVTTAEGKIAELEGTTGQHTTKLGELEQLITNNETDIEKKVSDLSGTVSTQGESIATNAQNIKKNSDDIAALPASITVSSDGSTGDYVSNITGNGKDGFKFTKTSLPSIKVKVTDGTATTSTEEVAVVSAVDNNGTTGHEVKLQTTKTAVVTKAGATSIAQAKANDAVTNFVAGVTVDANTTGAAIVDVVKGDNNSVTFKRGNINISTVEQTANTYVLFNCGSATEVI